MRGPVAFFFDTLSRGYESPQFKTYNQEIRECPPQEHRHMRFVLGLQSGAGALLSGIAIQATVEMNNIDISPDNFFTRSAEIVLNTWLRAPWAIGGVAFAAMAIEAAANLRHVGEDSPVQTTSAEPDTNS